MYARVSPLLLVNELLPSVSSLSLDSSLARDSLTDRYFLLPVAKLGPENVTASVVPPGYSTTAAELWLASILLSLMSALKL